MKIKYILAMIKRSLCKTFCSCYYKKELRVYLKEETTMGLVYRVYLGELGAVDVVSREVNYSVDDVASSVVVPANTAFVDLPPIAEGASVYIVVRDTDDAGNVGPWSEPYRFSTKDTIAPKMPGAVRLELLSEVASPEPDVQPPSTPDPEPPPTENTEEDTVLVDEPPHSPEEN